MSQPKFLVTISCARCQRRVDVELAAIRMGELAVVGPEGWYFEEYRGAERYMCKPCRTYIRRGVRT